MTVYTAERQYAEEAAVALEGMGMPRAFGKLLGWLLICDPPQQSSAQLADALDLSRGSVSTGTRMLETSGLIRRVVAPGVRGKVYEMTDDAMMRAVRGNQYLHFTQLMQRGVDLLEGADAGRSRRIRRSRDFFAFVNRELPILMDRFERECPPEEETSRG